MGLVVVGEGLVTVLSWDPGITDPPEYGLVLIVRVQHKVVLAYKILGVKSSIISIRLVHIDEVEILVHVCEADVDGTVQDGPQES